LKKLKKMPFPLAHFLKAYIFASELKKINHDCSSSKQQLVVASESFRSRVK